MERDRTAAHRGPRRGAEREASQPIGGQPRSADEDSDLQKPEDAPSFLTARELQARDPAKGESGADAGGERHGAASFDGPGGEPNVTDEEPPRGERGLPGSRSEKLRKRPG